MAEPVGVVADFELSEGAGEEVEGSLEFGAGGVDVLGGEDDSEDGGDVSIGAPCLGDGGMLGFGAVVTEEPSAQLFADEPDCAGVGDEPVEDRVAFGFAGLGEALAHDGDGRGVVEPGLELEDPVGGVAWFPDSAPSGEGSGEFVDVGFGVAAIDADGVEFEQFAGEVYVVSSGVVLVVVEEVHHRGVV